MKAAGLDEGYVRAWMLPDWWDDEVAENPSGLAMAEMYIARMTGLSIHALRSDEPLELGPRTLLRFKKRSDAESAEVRPAAVIAEQVAKGMIEAVTPQRFGGPLAAGAVRRHILATWRAVTLQALVDFAWQHGVIVAHIAELPRDSKKFDGIALFVSDRPVVLLASRRDSPAWLAFDLAHELGHVLLGHVSPGSDALSDFDLEERSDEPEEQAATRFALEVLTGDPDLRFQAVYGLTGGRLANEAQHRGPSNGIDPGVLALIYGRTADRIPAAQNALKILKITSGAHEIIADGLRRHLREDLPESIQMLVDLVVES